MIIKNTNYPTADTKELVANNNLVRIYNYCPCCRGESSPCRIETEMIISCPDDATASGIRWNHVSYMQVQQVYWDLVETVHRVPPARRNGEWIKFDVNAGNGRTHRVEMTLYEFLEIYKIMMDKHKATL